MLRWAGELREPPGGLFGAGEMLVGEIRGGSFRVALYRRVGSGRPRRRGEGADVAPAPTSPAPRGETKREAPPCIA